LSDKERPMQQAIRATKGPINAKLQLPGSKALTHRALILASLAEGVSEISNINLTRSTKAFISALRQLGIVIQVDDSTHSCIIAGCNGQIPKKQSSLWCDDIASLARVLLCLCAGTSGVYYFDASAKLHDKSIKALLEILQKQNVQFIPSDVQQLPFTM